jgi:flagellar operon protein
MNNRILIGPRPLGSVVQPSTNAPKSPVSAGPGAFQQVLDQALAPLKFSGHAQERLIASQRQLSENDLAQLARAVDKAAQKGARDTLILMRDLALVVSVTNRTVITAVDGDRMKDNIFTHIDSTVIL